jgi:hypothetical protein
MERRKRLEMVLQRAELLVGRYDFVRVKDDAASSEDP